MLKILTKSDKKQQNPITKVTNRNKMLKTMKHIVKENSIVNTINYKKVIMK